MLTAPLSRKIFPPANLSNKVWQIGLTDLGSYFNSFFSIAFSQNAKS
jgi:hypothetical protein